VQSALYSFSFEQKCDWSRPYAPQPEILAYLEGLAEKHGVLPHVRFEAGVRRASWREADAHWDLELESGEVVTAAVVVSALGMFNDLAWPDLEGRDAFRGTSFHSSRWNWDHDLTGETVGVIGSAASAVQFVPEIVEQAGQVHLFQRTANWVLPKLDAPYTEEELEGLRRDPSVMQAMRNEIFVTLDEGMTFADPKVCAEREAIGLAAIDVVQDPEVRAKLRPNHPFGCKRPLFSNFYYPAFNRPNLELVTDPITRITEDGIVTDDGIERSVDTIVYATGFATTEYLSAIDVVGRKGLRIDDAWSDGACAYLGITTAGFPNLFMLYGPNTNNGSILTMIEYQVAHIVQQARRLVHEDLAWIDVRPAAQERYNDEVQDGIGRVAVWQANCNGYYRHPSGRVVTQWPFSMTEYRRRTANVDPAAFEVGAR
jgi:cation diffusion facilitator CzcD-associated flavoprotein CzcO